MCTRTHRCPAWVSLHSAGLPYHGCLKDPHWLLSMDVLCCQSFCRPTVYVDLPGRRLTCLQTASQGSFGYIDVALYETAAHPPREVYVKRPILSGLSLLQEACVQIVVRECLQLAGFENGAPRVLEIFSLSNRSICFAMEAIHGAVTLDRFLETTPPSRLATVLLDCLLQLCSMMWHLGNDLGMNHRDLKPSNFMIVEHDTPRRQVVTVDTDILEIASSYSLTLIDFGFSCIGEPMTQRSSLSLSSVYPSQDPCPKEGRDLFLFLSLLYMDIHASLSEELLLLFEHWLFIPDHIAQENFLRELRRGDDDGNLLARQRWIYEIAGHEEIQRFQCSSLQMIRDIQALSSAGIQ